MGFGGGCPNRAGNGQGGNGLVADMAVAWVVKATMAGVFFFFFLLMGGGQKWNKRKTIHNPKI